MKKNKFIPLLSLCIVVAFCCGTLNAQITNFDALKLSHQDIVGSARYMGMAGAYGALGGDISAVKDNPAGLGVYRSSEIATTLNFQNQRTDATWGGKKTTAELPLKVGFQNISYVMSSSKWTNGSNEGLLQSNWAFSYNRLKNFNRNVRIKSGELGESMADYINFFTNKLSNGLLPKHFPYYDDGALMIETAFDDANLPWLSTLGYASGLIHYNNSDTTWNTFGQTGRNTASYNLVESGYIDEYALSWGGNISNKFYLGISVNLSTIDYTMTRVYSEDYLALNNSGMKTSNSLETSGIGFNMNMGVIYRPIDQLRLGLSYRLPTIYQLTDIVEAGAYLDNITCPEAYYDYRLHTPGKLNVSASYVFGKKAIISAEFAHTNFKNNMIYDVDLTSDYYDDDNKKLKENAKHSYLFKAGGEFRVTDRFSIRAGFAGETAIQNGDMYKRLQWNTVRTDTEYFTHLGTYYLTAGLGYRGDYWYFDAAFVNKNRMENFKPYEPESESFASARVYSHNYDVVATVGLKF